MNKEIIRPMHELVQVELIKQNKDSKGLIENPFSAQPRDTLRGKVIAKSNHFYDDHKIYRLEEISIGDIVLFPRVALKNIRRNKEILHFVRYADIFAIDENNKYELKGAIK